MRQPDSRPCHNLLLGLQIFYQPGTTLAVLFFSAVLLGYVFGSVLVWSKSWKEKSSIQKEKASIFSYNLKEHRGCVVEVRTFEECRHKHHLA